MIGSSAAKWSTPHSTLNSATRSAKTTLDGFDFTGADTAVVALFEGGGVGPATPPPSTVTVMKIPKVTACLRDRRTLIQVLLGLLARLGLFRLRAIPPSGDGAIPQGGNPCRDQGRDLLSFI